MNWTTIKAWCGEKTTIGGMAILASTGTGWASGQLTGGQAIMGVVGAVFLMVFRENLQTVLTSEGGNITVGRINADAATVNTTTQQKPAGVP